MIDDKELQGDWQMFKASLEQEPVLKNVETKNIQNNTPVFYSATFTLNVTGDTFLDDEKIQQRNCVC